MSGYTCPPLQQLINVLIISYFAVCILLTGDCRYTQTQRRFHHTHNNLNTQAANDDIKDGQRQTERRRRKSVCERRWATSKRRRRKNSHFRCNLIYHRQGGEQAAESEPASADSDQRRDLALNAGLCVYRKQWRVLRKV